MVWERISNTNMDFLWLRWSHSQAYVRLCFLHCQWMMLSQKITCPMMNQARMSSLSSTFLLLNIQSLTRYVCMNACIHRCSIVFDLSLSRSEISSWMQETAAMCMVGPTFMFQYVTRSCFVHAICFHSKVDSLDRNSNMSLKKIVKHVTTLESDLIYGFWCIFCYDKT